MNEVHRVDAAATRTQVQTVGADFLPGTGLERAGARRVGPRIEPVLDAGGRKDPHGAIVVRVGEVDAAAVHARDDDPVAARDRDEIFRIEGAADEFDLAIGRAIRGPRRA
jgi:hypothetical protein